MLFGIIFLFVEGKKLRKAQKEVIKINHVVKSDSFL